MDSLGLQLLKGLGVQDMGRSELAEAALQRHLALEPCAEVPEEVASCCWAALGVLRDLWAEPQGLEALRQGLVAVGASPSAAAAEALVAEGLGALLLAPVGRELRPAASLRCPTLLGHGQELPRDLVERIAAFLGQRSVALRPQTLQAWPCLAPKRLEALLWEAFFVDGLGAEPRRPADWRQQRAPADLAFSLGQELGSDGPRSLWATLLEEKAMGLERWLRLVLLAFKGI